LSFSVPLKVCLLARPPVGVKLSETLILSFPFLYRIFLPPAVGFSGTFT
jgi:hypothetical protein